MNSPEAEGKKGTCKDKVILNNSVKEMKYHLVTVYQNVQQNISPHQGSQKKHRTLSFKQHDQLTIPSKLCHTEFEGLSLGSSKT